MVYSPGPLEHTFVGAKRIFLPGYGAILYDEAAQGSPLYFLSHGNARVERTYYVRWGDRQAFCLAMLGYPTKRSAFPDDRPGLGPVSFDSYISRVLPHAHEDLVDPSTRKPYLFAQQISKMEGRGTTGKYGVDGSPQYHLAEVVVQYETLTYKLLSDGEALGSSRTRTDRTRYVTKLRKPGAEFIHLPRGVYRWFTPERLLAARPAFNSAAARHIPSIEILYVWHQVPFLPEALFKAYVGTLNKYRIDDGDIYTGSRLRDPVRVFHPGTLLLLSAEVKPYRMAGGSFVHDITYRFKYYEPEPGRGHNFFLRYDTDNRKLWFTKLTDSGLNDEIRIDPLDTAPTAPYRPGTVGAAEMFKGDTGRAVYAYRDFSHLFQQNIPVA